MWNNVIQTHIRRTTRNLAIATILLFVALGATLLLTSRYLYNFFLGPFPMQAAEVLSLQNPDSQLQYFVTIEGEDVLDTGLQMVQKTKNKYTQQVTSERVTASYMALLLNRNILIVKSPESEGRTQYTGALIQMPSEVHTRIVDEAESESPGLHDRFMPFMLDAGNFKTSGYIELAIVIPLLALGVWNAIKVVQRTANPASHPIMKALARYGAPEDAAAKIDADVQGGLSNLKVGPLTLTGSWLLKPSMFGLQLMNANDLVWLYKKVVQRRVNGVPAGKTYWAQIWDKHGQSLEIQLPEKKVEEALSEVHRRAPWALAGYDAQIENAWKKSRAQVIAAVDSRRAQYNATTHRSG